MYWMSFGNFSLRTLSLLTVAALMVLPNFAEGSPGGCASAHEWPSASLNHVEEFIFPDAGTTLCRQITLEEAGVLLLDHSSLGAGSLGSWLQVTLCDPPPGAEVLSATPGQSWVFAPEALHLVACLGASGFHEELPQSLLRTTFSTTAATPATRRAVPEDNREIEIEPDGLGNPAGRRAFVGADLTSLRGRNREIEIEPDGATEAPFPSSMERVCGAWAARRPDDHGDFGICATRWGLDSRLHGGLGENFDRDVFVFELAEAASLLFEVLEGEELSLEILDDRGHRLGLLKDLEPLDQRQIQPLQAGTYFLRVSRQNGHPSSYALRVERYQT